MPHGRGGTVRMDKEGRCAAHIHPKNNKSIKIRTYSRFLDQSFAFTQQKQWDSAARLNQDASLKQTQANSDVLFDHLDKPDHHL